MEKHHLLNLPFEILQTILWHMDAATFYTSFLTCKKFMEVAQSRRIILRHLCNLPGLRLGLADLSALELLLLFRKRAAQGLSGARVLATIKTYIPTHYNPKPSMSIGEASSPSYYSDSVQSKGQRASRYILSKSAFAQGRIKVVAMVCDFGLIHVFELTAQGVLLRAELDHRSSGPAVVFRYLVSNMAFSNFLDLAVLHKPQFANKVLEYSPFHQYTEPLTFRLVTYECLDSLLSNDLLYPAELQSVREIVPPHNAEPVGLAVAQNGNACIAWKSCRNKSRTQLMLISRGAISADPSYCRWFVSSLPPHASILLSHDPQSASPRSSLKILKAK